MGGNPYTGLNGLPGSGEAPVILASNASNSEVVLYQWNGTGSNWVPTNLAPFASFNASSPANQLGGTSLSVTNGTSGQVAIASYGQAVFALFTTFVNGETAPETMGSADGGSHWGGPYATSPGVASVRDPEAGVSPAGYVYVTWRENGAGPWQVDQAVYWPSGVSLVAPQPLPASGGGGLPSAGAPSLAIDGFGRPLYAWPVTFPGPSSNTTVVAGPAAALPNSAIEYSGDFVSAYTALQAVHQGFNHTVPADFENFGGPGLAAFRSSVNSTIQNLTPDVTNPSRLCASQNVSFETLYPAITENDVPPVLTDPAPACTLNQGLDSSIVAATSGPFSAGAYLQLETSNLLEALGVGTMSVPDWVTSLYSPGPALRGGDFVPGTPAYYNGTQGTRVVVDPVTLNPNSVWLNASGVFWTRYGSTDNNYTSGGSTTICGTNTTSDAPVLFSTNLTIKNQAGTITAQGTNNSPAQPPDFYVTHLRALRNGTWIEKLHVVYQYTAHSTTNCPASYGFVQGTWNLPPPLGWPKNVTITLSGTYTTGLSFYPDNVTVNSTGVNGNKNVMDDTVAWQNTVWAIADAWLNYSGNHSNLATWSNGTYQAPEFVHGDGFQAVPVGPNLTFSARVQTKSGAPNSSWQPTLNGNQVAPQPSLTQSYSCNFTQLGNYQRLWWYSSSNITDITADSATIIWFSNGNNSGWVDYQDPYGVEFNQTAMVNSTSNGTYQYTVQLHGLEPWSVYTLTAHVRAVHQCAVYQNQTNQWRFQTLATFQLAEQDLPYDSISKEGGGAQLFFQVPEAFLYYEQANFTNGTLWYFPWNSTTDSWDTGSTVTVPLSALPAAVSTTAPGLGWGTTYTLNLSALILNATYNVTLDLNWTVKGDATVHAYSDPYTFKYARDTSGDGLTDAEKARGWNVTAYEANVWNGFQHPAYDTWHVQAANASWATNGLVSDYTEKELGLDPRTIDTAQSHMLDTWNLTFLLGNMTCPTDFRCWYENTTNPYAFPQYPGGPENGSAWSLNYSGAHYPVEDSSPNDSYALWLGGSLGYLQGLIQKEGVGWLRGVIGFYPNYGTVLTVEGKLSWGANPLSYSTPSDGYADGARVNPLGETYLNVTVTSWYDNLGKKNGVAAFINSNQTVCCVNGLPFNQTDAGLYTQQVTAGSGGSTYGGNLGMFYNFPVLDDTQQYARLNVSLVQNVGGTISNVVTAGPVNVNLDNSSVHWLNHTGSNNIHATYQAVTVYSKAPTYILVPKDNSSLSGLPLGLERYTAEQNFVLVVVNATASDAYDRSVTGINYVLPNGTTSPGTYGVNLDQGLNNFLIPRALFLNTPFGQDVLNNTTVSIPGTNGTLGNWWMDQWYNGVQWRARATLNGYGGYNYTNTSGFLTIYSNSASQNCTGHSSLCGGVPSNPQLESGNESLAIQAVLTLNLSTYGAVADFLAALLFNRSGSYTGWLFGATQYLPSLGIASNVLGTLANPVLANAGAFSAPTSSNDNPLKDWGVAGAVIWNVVSGVAGAIEVLWNATLAAAAFFHYLIDKVGGWLLGALQQTASVLKAVASAMLSVIGKLLTWIVSLVDGLLDSAFKWVIDAINSTVAAARAAFSAAANLVLGVAQGLLSASGSAAAGLSNYITPAMIFGVGAVIGINIVLGITLPISLGATFVLSLLFPLLVTLVSGLVSLATPSDSTASIVTDTISGGSTFTVDGATTASQAAYNQTQHINSTKFVPAVVYDSTPGAGLNNNTTTQNQTPSGDTWAIVGAVVSYGAARILTRGAQALPADADAQLGAILAALIFLVLFFASLFSLGQNLSCAANPAGWTLILLATLAVMGLSFVGLKTAFKGFGGGSVTSKVLAALGFGFGLAGIFVAFLDLDNTYNNRCSWM